MDTKILQANDYKLIPSGDHIVRIKRIDDSNFEALKRISVIVEDVNGLTARANFSFCLADGSSNEFAKAIFARASRILLQNQILDKVEFNLLPGRFALARIEHSIGNSGQTFANITRWLGYANGFARKSESDSNPEHTLWVSDFEQPLSTGEIDTKGGDAHAPLF